MTTSRLLMWTLAAGLAAGCSSRRDGGDGRLLIDSGWFVGAGGSSDSQVAAVYQIAMPAGQSEGLCTATAVSDNTLIAAGHCIVNASEGGQRMNRVCLTKGDQRPTSTCSSNIYTPPSWERSEDFRQDVSVIVFPHGTFKNFFSLRTDAPSVGASVVLVGFSDENLTQSGRGMKRWGFNRIAQFDGDDAIISEYGGDGSSVAVSPGDSGGPLFSECKLVGVASREAGDSSGKESLHTNLADPANKTWLASMRANGAEICGLDGAAAGACPATSIAAPRAGASAAATGGQPLFPCVDAGTAATTSTDVYLALDAASGFHVGAPAGTASVKVCSGKSPACSAPATSARVERTAGSRPIFAVSGPTLSSGHENVFTLTALDAAGNALAQAVVDVK